MMRRIEKGLFVFPLILAAVVGIEGCFATSVFMKPVPNPAPMTPPEGKALIYFARPYYHATGILITIIDAKGNFIGESRASSRFARAVDPGEHLFIAWAENTAALKATVEAGKTYWVYVEPVSGLWVASRAALYAVRRGSDMWNERESYENDTKLFEVDVVPGQAHLNSQKTELDEAVKQGIETFNSYSDEEKHDATLRPEDGV